MTVREQVLEYIRRALGQARSELEQLEQQAARLRQRIAAYEALLTTDEDDAPSADPTVERLQGQSVHRSLVDIATWNAGTLRTRDATNLLVDAGVFQSRRLANKSIFAAVLRSRHFERVSRGLYRLVGHD